MPDDELLAATEVPEDDEPEAGGGEDDSLEPQSARTIITIYLIKSTSSGDIEPFSPLNDQTNLLDFRHQEDKYNLWVKRQSLAIHLTSTQVQAAQLSVQRASTTDDKYEVLRKAVAEYAGNTTSGALWHIAIYRTTNSFPLSGAANALNNASDWIRNIVEQPLAGFASAAGAPGPLAEMGAGIATNLVIEPVTAPLENAARICEIIGIAVGLATNLHPLVVACAKPLAHSELSKVFTTMVEQALTPTDTAAAEHHEAKSKSDPTNMP